MTELYNNFIALFNNLPARSLIISIAIFVIVILVNALQKIIFYMIFKKAFKNVSSLDVVYTALSRPIRIIVWLIGFWCFAFMLQRDMDASYRFLDHINKAFQIAILIIIAWAFLRLATQFKNQVIANNKRSDGGYDDFSVVYAISKVVEVIVVIVALITIMSILNIPISGLLTVGGISGAAIAFANQNLIANIFSGMAIFFDRPFSIGDWIYTNDGKIEGTVEKIGLRLTKIRGFDKRPIYVPNSMFNTSATVNASRMSNRRIKQYIGVRYCDIDKIPKIMSDIKNMLKDNIHIDQKMITLVNLVNGTSNMGSTIESCFGNYSINIQIYTFTKTTNWVKYQNIQDEVMLEIGKIVLENGAEFAFPTQSIYLEK